MSSTKCIPFAKTCIFCAIAFLTFYAISFYSKKNLNSFCALVEGLQQKNILDGEVCIIKNNNVILHAKSGSVMVNSPDKQSQFLIGSLSKQFTAVGLLHTLHAISDGDSEAERFSFIEKQLHKPLSQFLPSHSSIWNGSMPAWAHKITLHHLLSHTAGLANVIRDIFDTTGFDGVRKQLSVPHTPAQIISLLIEKPLLFEPGTSYAYSNEGYLLLTEVIAVISGMPFAQYIENLCHSIGMTSTYHPNGGNWKQIKEQQECSYLLPELVYNPIDKEPLLREPAAIMWDDVSNACGAGGIVSTVNDLITWNNALHKECIILPKALYALFTKPNLKNYAYGIQNKNGILTHNGELDSFFSKMSYIPKEDLLIIALFHINADENIKKTSYLLDNVLKTVIPAESERNPLMGKISAELDQKYPATRGAALIKKFEITA
jgi:CubicO group peptidase (beta-lactamase class C family)